MGKLKMAGVMPSGHNGKLMPERMYLVDESRVTLDGIDLGTAVRLKDNPTIGGVALPARGVLAIGQSTSDADNLGGDPAAALRAVADRSLAALRAPGALERTFPFMGGTELPGFALANICLMESVVHGWDIARGAGLDYEVGDDAVAAVFEFAQAMVTHESRIGRFGPAVAVPPDASGFVALLGYLGRRAG